MTRIPLTRTARKNLLAACKRVLAGDESSRRPLTMSCDMYRLDVNDVLEQARRYFAGYRHSRSAPTALDGLLR